MSAIASWGAVLAGAICVSLGIVLTWQLPAAPPTNLLFMLLPLAAFMLLLLGAAMLLRGLGLV